MTLFDEKALKETDPDFWEVVEEADKLAAVIPFVSQNQLASQVKRFQQFLCHADVIAIPTGE